MLHINRYATSEEEGFTLIELLVVIVIIGVLSAVSIPSFLNQVTRSRRAEGESAMANSASALTIASFDCGTYTLTLADLENGVSTCSGPNATSGWLETPWNTMAPNYSPLVITPNVADDGANLQTTGTAGAYASITCSRGVGTVPTLGSPCS